MCDRFLLKLLKKGLRETSISSAVHVKDAALQVLKSIPQERFVSELRKLTDYCKRVIELHGQYITK